MAEPRPASDRAHTLAVATAVALPFLVGAMAWRLGSGSRTWLTGFDAGVSIAITVLTLATGVAVHGDRTWLRAGIPAVLLAALVPFIVACRLGANPLRIAAFPSLPHAVALALITTLAVVGLVTRRLWGRWLGLALGASAIGSGALNALAFWSVTRRFDGIHPDWSKTMFETEWAHLVGLVVGVIIVVNLATARRGFDGGRAHPAWTSDEPAIRTVRLLMIASLMAIPMLLVYAWTQPVVPATRLTALVLAGVLGLGAIAAVRGRLLGVLTLTVGGFGLIAQTAVTYLGAHSAVDQRIATYYAVFWLPAGLLAIAGGLRIIGPTLRILRSR